jgi:hypothetical protein
MTSTNQPDLEYFETDMEMTNDFLDGMVENEALEKKKREDLAAAAAAKKQADYERSKQKAKADGWNDSSDEEDNDEDNHDEEQETEPIVSDLKIQDKFNFLIGTFANSDYEMQTVPFNGALAAVKKAMKLKPYAAIQEHFGGKYIIPVFDFDYKIPESAIKDINNITPKEQTKIHTRIKKELEILNAAIAQLCDTMKETIEGIDEDKIKVYRGSSHGLSHKADYDKTTKQSTHLGCDYKISFRFLIRGLGAYHPSYIAENICVDLRNILTEMNSIFAKDDGLDTQIYKSENSRKATLRLPFSIKEVDKNYKSIRPVLPIHEDGKFIYESINDITAEQFNNYLASNIIGESANVFTNYGDKTAAAIKARAEKEANQGPTGESKYDNKFTSLDDLKKILNALNKEFFGSRIEWLKLIYAVSHWATINKSNKASTIKALDKFCELCPGYTDDTLTQIDNEFNKLYNLSDYTGKVTCGTLFYWLKEQNPKVYAELFKESKKQKLEKIDTSDPFVWNDFFNKYLNSRVYESYDELITEITYDASRVIGLNTSGTHSYIKKDDCDNEAFTEIPDRSATTLFNKLKLRYKTQKQDGRSKDPEKTKEAIEKITFADICNECIQTYSKVGVYFNRRKNDPKILDRWRGMQAKLVDKVDMTKVNYFRHFARDIICNEKQGDDAGFRYLEKLIAFICQNEEETPGKALVLLGEQGTGKSTFTEFGADYLFGKRNRGVAVNIDHVTGQFQKVMKGKKLMVVNELDDISNIKDAKARFNKMKELITGKEASLNTKGVDEQEVDICFFWLMCSNKDNALYLEDDDRRHVIYKVSSAAKNDTKYFDELRKNLLNQECANHVYTYYMNMKNITRESINVPHMTKAKQDIINSCRETIYEFIKFLLEAIRRRDFINDYNKRAAEDVEIDEADVADFDEYNRDDSVDTDKNITKPEGTYYYFYLTEGMKEKKELVTYEVSPTNLHKYYTNFCISNNLRFIEAPTNFGIKIKNYIDHRTSGNNTRYILSPIVRNVKAPVDINSEFIE